MNLSDFNKSPKIDKVGVHERVSRFCKRSIKTSAKKHGLHLALSMIDLTTLEGKDTPEKVKRLCISARVVYLRQGCVSPPGLCISARVVYLP